MRNRKEKQKWSPGELEVDPKGAKQEKQKILVVVLECARLENGREVGVELEKGE